MIDDRQVAYLHAVVLALMHACARAVAGRGRGSGHGGKAAKEQEKLDDVACLCVLSFFLSFLCDLDW